MFEKNKKCKKEDIVKILANSGRNKYGEIDGISMKHNKLYIKKWITCVIPRAKELIDIRYMGKENFIKSKTRCSDLWAFREESWKFFIEELNEGKHNY